MKALFLISCLVFASACATTVEPKTSGPYAPHTPGRKGMVAYNPYGIKEIVDFRRDEALKKIYQTCGSTNHYKIINEEVRSTRDGRLDNALASAFTDRMNYVEYQCD